MICQKNSLPIPTAKNGFQILNLHPKKTCISNKVPFFLCQFTRKISIKIIPFLFLVSPSYNISRCVYIYISLYVYIYPVPRIVATASNTWENNDIFLFKCIRIKDAKHTTTIFEPVILTGFYTTMYFIGRVTMLFANNSLMECLITMKFLHIFFYTLT